MKILVLNGSPAGKDSITLQTVEYLKVVFPEHEYQVLHAAQQIRKIEKDFSEASQMLIWADLILFCYPVYTFLVPAQLHRFIELMKESGIDLSGKYASQITTSKHFYDMTAHRFISDICADLHLSYVRGLSADMEDILSKKGQREAREYFRFLIWNMRHGFAENPSAVKAETFAPVIAAPAKPSNRRDLFSAEQPSAHPGLTKPSKHRDPFSAEQPSVHPAPAKSSNGRDLFHAALVTDYDPEKGAPALAAMIRRFSERLPGSCEIINLREFPFQGGCLGCFHCASDGACIYKDGFDSYLREHINSADAVVYAFTIKDHSMGSRFKLYDDRQFCNGHRTVTMGKPVAYLVDGDLSEEENLRTLMEARAQVGGNYLAGVASDKEDPDREVDSLVHKLTYVVHRHYEQPKNFYGVGGLKIFRDLIFEMQGLMKEDHQFYKEHGFYDFPQKKRGRIAGMYLVSAMMNSKILRKNSKFSMTEGMLLPYRNVIEKVKGKTN